MSIEAALERLSGLWEKTGNDWNLQVYHCLTEPTCPTAVIAPEGSNSLQYAVYADTVEEAILKAADLVYRGEILGEHVRGSSPVTNPDDRRPPPPKEG